MPDLAYLSAIELAGLIRAKKLSSREALDHLLERVARLDGPINAVVTVDPEQARAAADAADRALARGDTTGPLHGVPMTVKDSFQTAGMRTTAGAPELADFVPAEDAWPVARLRAAGAVIYGKTNLPLYAGDLQTYNAVFGTTNNPFDASRTPGGSSGGAAAALACGFTPLELGSDIGGSIRMPAHMSGVTGHKPSYGIVPAHGQIPGAPGTLTQADIAVAGPMARGVEDLELALDLLSGPDRWNRPGWRLELPAPRGARIADYRVATWLDDAHSRVEPAVRERLEAAAAALADAGAKVVAEARPAFTLAKAADTFGALLQAALSGGFARDKLEAFAADQSATPVGQTRRRLAIRHREWLSNNERRLQMRLRWEEFFTDWDVCLLPVAPCPAIEHDHSDPQAARTPIVCGEPRPYLELITWMAPAGACYLPATVVPVGQTGDGLPVGIQVVGPFLGDRTTLHVARILGDIIGGCPRPPGF